MYNEKSSEEYRKVGERFACATLQFIREKGDNPEDEGIIALTTAIECINKQLEVIPDLHTHRGPLRVVYMTCPTCGFELRFSDTPKYCENCGQRLSWKYNSSFMF